MSEERRPDPEALLARAAEEEGPSSRRGRFKVFLGAAAGVGKTYAMLEAAGERRRSGIDVVTGVIETHGRRDTEHLLEGLEILPRRTHEHRGIQLGEFDLDAALARKPQLILVDELAHTNAPGCRHTKRWQDVEELLGAGIDVYTTMNVQHLESLNDVVARITHVKVRETVPDAVFERADEVELVDLPPEELLKRLADGRVYVPEHARRAIESFFRKGNLIALRQLALRHVAERVDAQMLVHRRAYGVRETWPIAERIVVGVGPAPSSADLVRATKRMADRLRAEWIAVFIETPEYASFSREDRDRVWETLRLAEELGGKTDSPTGSSSGELLAYARAHNATKIVVGKPTHARWRDRLFGSRLDEIVRSSGDIDVYVISGLDQAQPQALRPASRRPVAARSGGPLAWSIATLAVAVTTVIAILLRGPVELENIVMLYLLLVIVVASRAGRAIAIHVSILSVAAFDFFCVPPYLTFEAADTRYIPVFGVMLLVALVISTLTTRLRRQAEASRQAERRTAALLDISRDLAYSADASQAIAAGVRRTGEVFDSGVTVLMPDSLRSLTPAATWNNGNGAGRTAEDAVARWVFDHGRPAGRGTDTLPAAVALYLPLLASGSAVGVLAVRPADERRFRDPEQMHLLETFANHIAGAIERTGVGEARKRADQALEMSRLRTEFVSTASHELRTPLTSLALNVDLLEESHRTRGEDADRVLLGAIRNDTARLRTLADDLLDLARLESGRMPLNVAPVAARALLEPPVSALGPLAKRNDVRLSLEVRDGLPRVEADERKVYTVVSNLVTNAIHHAGRDGDVIVTADDVGDFVQFSVANTGPGIAPEDQALLFERFSRPPSSPSDEGTGLGLAIARQIVIAHGGLIWVDSGPGPGAVFSFTLPVVAVDTAGIATAAM
jgi:two-component system, OmpR family, sensor histidine kinase KdpD